MTFGEIFKKSIDLSEISHNPQTLIKTRDKYADLAFDSRGHWRNQSDRAVKDASRPSLTSGESAQGNCRKKPNYGVCDPEPRADQARILKLTETEPDQPGSIWKTCDGSIFSRHPNDFPITMSRNRISRLDQVVHTVLKKQFAFDPD